MITRNRHAFRLEQEQDWLENLETLPNGAALDPTLFRKSVSLFSTGIVVISVEEDEGKVHGMTINSFTSISLDPPTVLISLKPGKTHRCISRGGRFGASILRDEQQPYSAHFSGRPQESLKPDFLTRDRLPTLRNCLAWFECAVIEKVQVHDHTLFVAEVTACGNEDGSPLMFYASRYHRPIVNSS